MYATRARARSLGAVDDPFADDFASDGSSDPRNAYLAWVAAVKSAGGVATVMPHINAGALAARYPFDVIYPAPAYALNPLFSQPPDEWTADSSYGYYRAPAEVLQYQLSGALVKNSLGPDTSASWYENLLTALKYAGYGVAALIVLEGLSFLPRRRD